MAAVALSAVAAGPALAARVSSGSDARARSWPIAGEAEFLSTPPDGAPETTRRVTPDAISPAPFSMFVRRVRARARRARDSGKP